MYTQCPHCDAIFQVTTAQLKAANGEVRCGQCLSVFNALNHLSDEIPASTDEQATNPVSDTGSDDPWTDDSPVDGNPADASPSESTTEDTFSEPGITDDAPHNDQPITKAHFESAPIAADSDAEKNIETSTEVTDADIFSKVIAEANRHNLPTEEMDRFEEFLSVENPVPEDANTGDAPDNALKEEANKYDAGEFETLNPNDAEAVTAELESETHTDTTDEFTEFDEYQTSTNKTDELSNTAHAPDFGTEDEAIIIEEADLAPITSKDYLDNPEFNSADNLNAFSENNINNDTLATNVDAHADADDFSELAEAAAEIAETTPHEPPPPKSDAKSAADETLYIPSLIMEDLHAAKAEQLRPSNTPWVVGSLILMLTLVLQVVYYSRDELAKDASLRPWLIQMCQLTNCTLTQPYDITQIDIIGREVRTHPSARKALIASTTLINNANFMQPFPLLTVVFADINGKPMAQRRFTPREYLSNMVDLDVGMTPDMPVRIELELVDPGKAAVNYEFHAELDPRNTRPLT